MHDVNSLATYEQFTYAHGSVQTWRRSFPTSKYAGQVIPNNSTYMYPATGTTTYCMSLDLCHMVFI